jgi:hypothetical protein
MKEGMERKKGSLPVYIMIKLNRAEEEEAKGKKRDERAPSSSSSDMMNSVESTNPTRT